MFSWVQLTGIFVQQGSNSQLVSCVWHFTVLPPVYCHHKSLALTSVIQFSSLAYSPSDNLSFMTTFLTRDKRGGLLIVSFCSSTPKLHNTEVHKLDGQTRKCPSNEDVATKWEAPVIHTKLFLINLYWYLGSSWCTITDGWFSIRKDTVTTA